MFGAFLCHTSQNCAHHTTSYGSHYFVCVPRTASKHVRSMGYTIVGFLVLIIPFFTYAETRININTADSETLDTLPGIGPSKAEAIIEYRETYGLFGTIEEIKNVSGIGDATYADIKADITVGNVATDTNTSASDEDIETEATSRDEEASSSSTEKKVPLSDIVISAPKVAYVNQPVAFDVNPRSGTSGRLVRYTWNLGDGMVSNEKTPEHTFLYPGTYVVMVESYYAKENHMARHELKVLDAELVITRSPSGDIHLHNDGNDEIDLGGFTLTGDTSFTFPKYTILLSGSTLTIPHSRIDADAFSITLLYDPMESLIASHMPRSVSVAAASVAPAPQASFIATDAEDASLEEVSAHVTSNAEIAEELVHNETQSATAIASVEEGTTRERLPYLGLIGLILLGLIGVYTRRST